MDSPAQKWEISLESENSDGFAAQTRHFLAFDNFLHDPDFAIECAVLQKFAKITPQYPGIRAPLENEACRVWLAALAPMLDQRFGVSPSGWEMQAWFSIVTTPADQLIPMQRFPHVDGTDPNQLAMMLYLDATSHGGTGFFRHLSSGLEALTKETFPIYRAALEKDVSEGGLPDAAYTQDGAPYFERIAVSSGTFNQAIFYRGNQLHSGIIDNSAPLSPDPRAGRLTINAFFRPKG